MYHMEDRLSRTEAALLETSGGYALLDELAQANIDPNSLPTDELEHLLSRPNCPQAPMAVLVQAAG